jgi:hypothetical protein
LGEQRGLDRGRCHQQHLNAAAAFLVREGVDVVFTAALLAEYAPNPGVGTYPVSEPSTTICPPPRARIPGSKASPTRTVPT